MIDLSRLNPSQREAVLHGEGPLLVLAGAGSGKTSTMSYRVAHLVATRKVPASAVLGLSFTNKAAGELKERVHQLIARVAGPSATSGLTVTTFHSLCARLLRAHADLIGFGRGFTIVDDSDQKDILKQIFRQIRIDDRKFDLGTILFEIGQAKNRFLRGTEAEAHFLESRRLPQDYAIATATAFSKYQEKLRLLNAMDFDDLLLHAVALLEREDVRGFYGKKFRHILVDEYQDTNPTQFRLLSLLTTQHQNLCVVGDDDQSIYGWRGADAAHILEFTRHFPGARTITLDQNYRSTNSILEAANQVISNNRKRHPKQLWSDRGEGEPLLEFVLESDREESEFVAEEIERRAKERTAPWRDFAILYRSNAQARIFEEALRFRRIPYKIVGGMSFLDRKEIKDTLSYWRLIVNLRDDASLRRVVNWPSRGIGAASIEALNAQAFKQEQPLFEALSNAPAFAQRAAGSMLAFRNLILELRQELEALPSRADVVAQWGRRSLERIGVRKAIEDENDDPVAAQKKWEIAEELANSLGLERAPDGETPLPNGLELLREFIARLTLQAQEEEENREDAEKNSDRNEVTLLTLHGAKGLEYPVVFLVGMEEGFLPHQRTIDEATDLSEERRLAYVGITRARDHLILTRTKNRIRWGKPMPRNPSRFLEEIPKHLVIRKDDSLTPDLSSKASREEHEERVTSYLSGIREMLMKK